MWWLLLAGVMMATDPITGLSLDEGDRSQEVLDYLGRKSPLGLSQQTALPGVQGAAPGTAPASPGGMGGPSPSESIGGVFGQNTFDPDIPGLGERLGAAAAGQIAGQAKGQLQGLLPGGPTAQETITAPQGIFSGVQPGGPVSTGETITAPANIFGGVAPVGGVSESILAPAGIFTGVEAVGPVSTEAGAGLGAGASAGAGLGVGSILGAYGGLSAIYDLAKLGLLVGGGNSGGPTTGNMWGDLGFSLLGGPIGDAGKAITGRFLEPSNAWQQFGGKLAGTLYGESSAISTLVPWLGQAKTRGDVGQAVDFFRQLVETGAGVGGYQLGSPSASGAPQIGTLPGATGTRHEGGLTADFGPVTKALNEYISSLYAALPEGGPSGPMTYESFAAGLSPAELEKFLTIANTAISMPLDQQADYVRQSGYPDQDRMLRYVAGSPQNWQTQRQSLTFEGSMYNNPENAWMLESMFPTPP